jgi:hypothetical protein
MTGAGLRTGARLAICVVWLARPMEFEVRGRTSQSVVRYPFSRLRAGRAC